MIDLIAAAEFQKELARYVSTLPRNVFTPEIVGDIGNEFGIDPSRRDLIGYVLEVGAAKSSLETERAQIDLKSVRKELKHVAEAVEAARNALLNLTDATQRILVESGAGRTLGSRPLPRVGIEDEALVVDYAFGSGSAAQRLPMAEVTSLLSAIAQCVIGAGKSAGENKPGKPANEALSVLLNVCFVVWEKILNRQFKLDWADDNMPLTDAAEFCVRMVRVVDPDTELSKIKSMAITVRKHVNDSMNLQEFNDAAGLFPEAFWIAFTKMRGVDHRS